MNGGGTSTDDALALYWRVAEHLTGTDEDVRRAQWAAENAEALAATELSAQDGLGRAARAAARHHRGHHTGLSGGHRVRRYRTKVAPLVAEFTRLLRVPVVPDPDTMETHSPHTLRLRHLTDLIVRASRAALTADEPPGCASAAEGALLLATIQQHGATQAHPEAEAPPARRDARDDGRQHPAPSAAPAQPGNGQFLAALAAYQGRAGRPHPPRLLADVERKLAAKGLVDHGVDAPACFHRVTREAVLGALQQLRAPRAHRDATAVADELCCIPPPCVAHLEPALLLRYELLRGALRGLEASPDAKRAWAPLLRRGLPPMYLLFHLLRDEGASPDPGHFEPLRNADQIAQLDAVLRAAYARLGWPFRWSFAA